MSQFRRVVLAAACLAGLAGTAEAQAPAAGSSCVTYDGAYERAPLMKVGAVPGGRLYLQDQAKACASKGRCAWRRAGYLTPGDIVLASAPRNGFRCIYYGTRGGKLIAGFVPAASLQAEPDGGPADAAFLTGDWVEDGGNSIEIKRGPKGLTASGTAIYGQNSGEFEGPVRPTRSGFAVSSEGCEVEARRRGPYLIVSDNGACGGLNVSFGGIYTRSR